MKSELDAVTHCDVLWEKSGQTTCLPTPSCCCATVALLTLVLEVYEVYLKASFYHWTVCAALEGLNLTKVHNSDVTVYRTHAVVDASLEARRTKDSMSPF